MNRCPNAIFYQLYILGSHSISKDLSISVKVNIIMSNNQGCNSEHEAFFRIIEKVTMLCQEFEKD